MDESGPTGADVDLSMVAAGIGALHALASDPAKAGDGASVYDFSIRWGTLMSGRLMRLEHYYRAGDLTEDQKRRYRDLRRELREAAPQAGRLGLGRPTVSLED